MCKEKWPKTAVNAFRLPKLPSLRGNRGRWIQWHYQNCSRKLRNGCFCACAVAQCGIRWNITVQHGSAETVMTAMNAFNGKCRFSSYASSETPWPIFKKKLAQLITSGTPPQLQVFASIGSKGACLHMREVVPAGIYFFLFLMVHAHRYRSASWTDHRR